MKKLTLKFPSLLELIDFEIVALETAVYEVNRNKMTISGNFTQEELAEAKLNHKAQVIETSEQLRSQMY